MKKLLLLVGLVVLFFAQSSYADVFYGHSSNIKWVSWNFGMIETHYGNKVDKKLELQSLSHFESDKAPKGYAINEKQQKEIYKCFNINSKSYLNVDRCESIKFHLRTKIKKEPENTRRIKSYVNILMKDICENPKIKYDQIKTGNLLTSGKVYFTLTCPKVLANRKIIEEEKKLVAQTQEQAMTKEKEQELLASVNAKRELCFSMGFKDGTDPLANCILQLMLSENKKQQVVVTSGNDGLAGAMDEQTRILSKQLRIQKIQLNSENLKRSIYMMNTGKVPTW